MFDVRILRLPTLSRANLEFYRDPGILDFSRGRDGFVARSLSTRAIIPRELAHSSPVYPFVAQLVPPMSGPRQFRITITSKIDFARTTRIIEHAIIRTRRMRVAARTRT